jgi:hypothetical protein
MGRAHPIVLRNVNTGAFEVYDIANHQLTGAAPLGSVGLEWQVGGFAADPPSASSASMGDSSQAAQLGQAMAGFGGSGGAAERRDYRPSRDRNITAAVANDAAACMRAAGGRRILHRQRKRL